MMTFLSFGFRWRRRRLGRGNQALDSRIWYTPAEAHTFLDRIGAAGRRLYGVTQVTLDVLFPLAYGVLLAALIVRLYDPPYARVLVMIPLLTIAADLLENTVTAFLAFRFNRQASPLAWTAARFTAAKWLLFALSLLLIFTKVISLALRSFNYS
jgi:hypothetical protein